jgi:hypothetical protein
MRGEHRTFIALQGGRVAGAATALWRQARDGRGTMTVGEVMDLRVAPWARGGRIAFQLLHALHEVFIAQQVDWILCLIGKHNHAASGITAGKGGFPCLLPLEEFASVHFMALRAVARASNLHVRRGHGRGRGLAGRALRAGAGARAIRSRRGRALARYGGEDHAWIAFGPDGAPRGALVAWDGEAVRRLRIMQYRAADLPLRAAMGVTAWLGLSPSLPAPGEVLRMWATRLVTVRSGGADTLRALILAALASGVSAGRNVVQVNLRARDPLLTQLPPYPRSTYWSTLYGGPLHERTRNPRAHAERFHADIARA